MNKLWGATNLYAALKTSLLLLLLLGASVRAEDIKTVDGQLLKDATITGKDALGVIVSHSDGIARVPYDKLPEELRKQFHYDAKEARMQQEAEHKAAVQSAQSAQAFEQQKTAAAAKAHAVEAAKPPPLMFVKPARGTIGKPGVHILRVTGRVLQVVSEGVLLGRWQSYTLEPYGNNNGASVMSEPLLVVGADGKLVDGEEFTGVVYPAGRYTYTSVIGGGKTVHRYATSPQVATKLQNDALKD